MPGYQLSRFVDLSNSEKELFVCLICDNILKIPVAVPCCSEIYCDDCVHQWLQTNTTCPCCRESLTESQLTSVPLKVVNSLGKLHIKCDYQSNGCKDIVQLEALQLHCDICQLNPENTRKPCQECGMDKEENHNCVSDLVNLCFQQRNQISELQSK